MSKKIYKGLYSEKDIDRLKDELGLSEEQTTQLSKLKKIEVEKELQNIIDSLKVS